MRRRQVLGTIGALSTVGCLRLGNSNDGDTQSNSSATTELPNQTGRPSTQTTVRSQTAVPSTDTSTQTTTSSSSTSPPPTTTASSEEECRYFVAFDFNEVYSLSDLDRFLAFACYEINVISETGQTVQSYDIGNQNEEPQFLQGVHEPEEDNRRNSFRWFGTEAARTEMLLNPLPTDTTPGILQFEGDAAVGGDNDDRTVSATVIIGEQTADEFELDYNSREYTTRFPDEAECGL